MSATGDYIREAREQRGLTLGQVEEATRIPRYYLEILEGGGDDRLVSDRLYMVHFLRGYAAFLEVEVETLAAQFVRENRHMESAQVAPPERGRSRTTIVLATSAALLVAGAGLYVMIPGLVDLGGPSRDQPVVVSTATPTPAKQPVTRPLPVAAPALKPDDSNSSVLQPEADETTPSEPRLVATPPPQADSADNPEPEPAPAVEPAASTQGSPIPTATRETSVPATPEPPDGPVLSADQQVRLSTSDATAAGAPDTREPRPSLPGRTDGETGNPGAPETTAVAAVSEPPATSGSAVPGTHSLTISADEKSWLRVWADGGRYRDMLLEPGETRTLSAENGFRITFGNAGGVRLSLNGEELPRAGASGQVVRDFEVPIPRQDTPR